MRDSPLYTLSFAAAVCVVCALLVSSLAVALRPAQARNRNLDLQRRVLVVAGLVQEDEKTARSEVRERFGRQVQPLRVELQSGRTLPLEHAPPQEELRPAPPNEAGLVEIPRAMTVYVVDEPDGPGVLILPIRGQGLWSTIEGLLALDRGDLRTIRGIEFIRHGETAGLGDQIDDPRWKAGWQGRLAYDDRGVAVIRVGRGPAGPPDEDPYRVDALTGATLTARGVTQMLQFWLSGEGYGPLLQRLHQDRS